MLGDGANERQRVSHANGAGPEGPASARAGGAGGAKPPGLIKIAPSLLSADFAALGDAVAKAERGGADLIHVDIMDGHFVPNLTVGPPVVKSLSRIAHVPLDVHLMIEEPDRFVEAFVEAGAASLTVHVEAVVHLHRTVQFIKSFGIRAGVALNPATPVTSLEQIAGDVDYVLVMTVNPGFGGQTFIPRSESKVRAVRELLRRQGSSAPIEVDGGIDVHTAPRIVAAGADILVAGNAVFGTSDPERAIRALRVAAESAVA
ncbi:MAG TPA: ribulose-phosphate 3-epimerase [Vicinamibacterales bacterium]|nr:ribulose-phosphate 3-epimerase [Vicinamibacterales bacterium]